MAPHQRQRVGVERRYVGIDLSPAPAKGVSIGAALEELTQQLFHLEFAGKFRGPIWNRFMLSGTVLAPDDVAVFGIQPMGYGIQLVFSDGHAQGIYPWAYLDALAPRASASHA